MPSRLRSVPVVLVATLATLTVTAFVAPADAAGHPHKRQAVTMLHKQLAVPQRAAALDHHANRQADAGEQGGEEDEDEAGALRARAAYEQSIVAAPAAVAPAAGLLEAHRAAAALPSRGRRWDEVTDKPFLNDPVGRGQNYGVGWGVVTGRMTAFTARGGSVWAGSASGGVWRTGNRGKTWTTDDKGLPRLAVGALATSPKDDSLWVGTGEPNNSAESQYGVGVYQQKRGSKTWRRVGGHEIDGAGVHRISWIGSYVYAATTHGLFRRSRTASRTTAWTAVLQPGGPALYPPTSDVTDVIAVPGSRGREVLAVVGWMGFSDPPDVGRNGFYVGSGGAGSFARVGLTGDIDAKTVARTTLSSSQGRLYAVVADSSTGDLSGQGVFVSRSGDPAGPWSRIADVDKLAASGSALGDLTSGYYPGVQAWYNQNIVADPKDADHLYLQLEEVFESTDGGASWATVGPYWNYDISCEQADGDPYDCPPTTHPDQHAGMIYRGQFWAGNDGGVWRRPTSQHSRGRWTNLNADLHTLQNFSVAAGPVGKETAYWGGLQDNGESYARTNLKQVEQAFTGDGGDTLVDPRAGDRAVMEYTNLDMWRTTDGGQTQTEISPSCLTATDPPKTCDPNPRFIAPIEMDVHDPDHWVAGGQYVWIDTKSWATTCDSAGCDWKKVYDTGEGHQVTALGVSGGTTYAAWCGPCNPEEDAPFERGLATNVGGSWHTVPLDGIPNRYLTSIAVDPANPAHVYVSVGSYSRRWIPDAGQGHVFESRDGGGSWTDVSGTLPDAPVYTVAIAGSQLVAGTEVGVFGVDRSTSTPAPAAAAGAKATAGGRSVATPTSWYALDKGLPEVTVWDLQVTSGGELVAGTHGRGTWRLKLPAS
ncbi:beta propeller repeat protein [Microlunatus flavus]|uniref:Glycosyl hydrolase n=1 Tax=Microlunatus flavus TaxID=1036181 RepID=A0A1H9KJV8_9ACTN|nr:hypothetical protein [Microlunatus flavus]SEQ99436.1 hypothetical protein SAMN05421756_107251 [Microlunatus flavus]